MNEQRTPEERERAATLAEQRLEDITSAAHRREMTAVDLAVEKAKRDLWVDGQLKESRDRLDRINGSIDRTNAHLKASDERLASIERAFGEWTAVAKAITEKGVGARGLALATAAVLVPLLVLVVNALQVK